jgi:hypothetical protein
MRSYFYKLFIALVIISISALAVWAGLGFSGGAGFGSGSVIIDASLRGVSNARPATITATITDGGPLTAVCRNNGGNIAYGQNPVTLSNISATQTVTPNSLGNADSHFHIDVIAAGGITWQVAGCPNKNWTVTDLLGSINVQLVASDGTFTDTLNYACFTNEIAHVIACTQS